MFERWYERFPRRLQAEKIIMNENHPQFVLMMDSQKNLFWEGILRTNFGTEYDAIIAYPTNYPWDKPKSRIVRPEIRWSAPHRYGDGTLCVYPNEWDQKSWTAPAAVPLIAAWCALYEHFVRRGERW